MTVRLQIVVVVGLVAGWAASATAQWQTKVITVRAETRPMQRTMMLVGTVEPVTRSVLGTEVAGLVVEMPVRQGDLVDKGQTLCHLEDTTLTLQYERENARLDALQARLQELENGTRSEELAKLKADLDAAKALAVKWDYELERVQKLQGGDYANEKEYQDALAEQQAAKARERAAEADYKLGVEGPRKEVIAAARFAVAEQKAVTDRVKSDLDKTRIQAPFAGHVTNRYAEVGNWLVVGGPVVELADLSTVLVAVNAPESVIPYAAVGAPVSVYSDALEKTFHGVIKYVTPQADVAARSFPVEIEVDNPDFALKSGMFSRATVPAGPAADTVAVPKDAIIENRGNMYVAVIKPGEQGTMAMPTPVTLGADDGEWVAITSGNLPGGSEVAVYGNERLIFPQPVVVVQSRDDVDAAVESAGEESDSMSGAGDAAQHDGR